MYVAQASYVGAPGLVSRLKPRGGGYIIYMNKYFIMNIYFFYIYVNIINSYIRTNATNQEWERSDQNK